MNTNLQQSESYSKGLEDAASDMLEELKLSSGDSLATLKLIEESLEETKRITGECFSELARLRCELEGRNWDHAEGEGRR